MTRVPNETTKLARVILAIVVIVEINLIDVNHQVKNRILVIATSVLKRAVVLVAVEVLAQAAVGPVRDALVLVLVTVLVAVRRLALRVLLIL